MPNTPKGARDPELIDALDARAREIFEGSVWRVVRGGRDPLEPSRAGGRWDLGRSDVLYTSTERNGAIAEVEYQLSRQPVFPSRIRSAHHKIHVRLSNVIRLEKFEELVALGDRTREIGDAAAFLGCDALIVPSARWECLNVVLFLEAIEPENIEKLSGPNSIDWKAWRMKHVPRKRL